MTRAHGYALGPGRRVVSMIEAITFSSRREQGSVFTRLAGYLGLSHPRSRRDRKRQGWSPAGKYRWGAQSGVPE
jgi:hypothetical protein